MITEAVSIKTFPSPEKAPHHSSSKTAVKITHALVVAKGTIRGNPTVDLLLVDEEGNQYVAMVKYGVMDGITTVMHANGGK